MIYFPVFVGFRVLFFASILWKQGIEIENGFILEINRFQMFWFICVCFDVMKCHVRSIYVEGLGVLETYSLVWVIHLIYNVVEASRLCGINTIERNGKQEIISIYNWIIYVFDEVNFLLPLRAQCYRPIKLKATAPDFIFVYYFFNWMVSLAEQSKKLIH